MPADEQTAGLNAGRPSGSRPVVRAVAWSHFEAPADVPWTADATDAADAEGPDALGEFAGRACYRSWDKPNPATATNAGYLDHLLEVGHLAALEHASVTFYVTGVSRSLAHELMRHRHLSFSQLSQRHAPQSVADFVEPDVVAADPRLHARFVAAVEAATEAHAALLGALEESAQSAVPGDVAGADADADADTDTDTDTASSDVAALRRKQARQAVRALVPEAARTELVVTGNLRAWRHVVAARGSEHADAAMREVVVAMLRELRRIAPNSFADFVITALPDGSEVAASPLVTDS